MRLLFFIWGKLFPFVILILPSFACNKVENIKESDPNAIKILAIGNSFAEDAVNQNLCELFLEDSQSTVIGCLFYGGCSLYQHWNYARAGKTPYRYTKTTRNGQRVINDVSLIEALKDEEWDYISFQQVSDDSGDYSTFQPYLESLIKCVDKNSRKKAKLMWHQTWAYANDCDKESFSQYENDQMKMYQSIVECSKIVLDKEKRITILIPCGTAIQNGRSTTLGDTFNRDGYHLKISYGRYLAACTWFEAISGHSVEGMSYHPKSIDDKTAAVCQWAARQACLSPYETSSSTP